jgi:hypothetical protein
VLRASCAEAIEGEATRATPQGDVRASCLRTILVSLPSTERENASAAMDKLMALGESRVGGAEMTSRVAQLTFVSAMACLRVHALPAPADDEGVSLDAQADHLLMSLAPADFVEHASMICVNVSNETLTQIIGSGEEWAVADQAGVNVPCAVVGDEKQCSRDAQVLVRCVTSSTSHLRTESLLVLDVVAPEVDPSTRRMASDVVIARAAAKSNRTVTSADDVRALFDVLAARAVFDENADALSMDLGRAVEAEQVLASTMVQRDGLLVIDLRLLDVKEGRVLARARADGRDKRELLRRTPVAVDSIFNPRSKGLPRLDLGRRASDVEALLGAGISALAVSACVGFGCAAPSAFLLALPMLGVNTLPTIPCLTCPSLLAACAVPCAATTSPIVDRILGYEAGFVRSGLVAGGTVVGLIVAPLVPLALVALATPVAVILSPATTTEERLNDPFALALTLGAGVLGMMLTPVVVGLTVAVSYELGIVFAADVPLLASSDAPETSE